MIDITRSRLDDFSLQYVCWLLICSILELLIGECSASLVKIESVTPPIQHAEGPHWDAKSQTLYYVDTFQATAYRYDPSKTCNQITCQKIEGKKSIGIIVPVKDRPNEFVVASDRYLYELNWNSNQNNTGSLTEIHMVDGTKPKNQFNDGKADARGRLWIGTLTRESDLSVSPHGGSLYRFDFGEKYSEQIANTSVSNGIAWSKDNTKFFHCDSQPKTITKYQFDLEKGTLGEKKVLFNLNEHPNFKGIPDGLTIDENDNLWVALFGGHGVLHINGTDGKIIKFVKLPVTYCTATCFGGKSQDTLYVSTSKLHLTKEHHKNELQAGSVFAITGLGVRGAAPYECILE